MWAEFDWTKYLFSSIVGHAHQVAKFDWLESCNLRVPSFNFVASFDWSTHEAFEVGPIRHVALFDWPNFYMSTVIV